MCYNKGAQNRGVQMAGERAKHTGRNIAIGVVVVAVAAAVIYFGASKGFDNHAKEELSSLARVKELEAEAALSGQLSLVLQMQKSPAIGRFLLDSEDESAKENGIAEFAMYNESFPSKAVFWVSDTDHVFWSGLKPSYTVNVDDPAEYWYKMTMTDAKSYNFNINYNANLKAIFLWINARVTSAGKAVGVVGNGIGLTDFVKGMYKNVADDIVMYLYTETGTVVGASDLSILETQPDIRDVFPALKNESDIITAEPKIVKSGKWTMVFHPISLLGLHLVVAREQTIRSIMPYTALPIVICVAIALVAFVVYIFVSIARLMTTMRDAVDDLSSGNADLTARLTLKLSTHMFNALSSSLIDSFNKFIAKLQGIMKEIKSTKDSLSERGGALGVTVKDNAAHVELMSGGINGVEKQLGVQVGKVNSAVEAAGGISEAVSALGDLLSVQEGGVESASSAVTQMIGNIDSVSRSMERMAGEFDVLKKDVNSGINKEREVNTQLQEIQEQSNMLNDANSVISSIAEQTNLLAMNAAIEAAHAGEAGKGFAVVADEIRKLSENSSAQSQNIGHQLSSIMEAIKGVVVTSEESDKVFNGVNQKIEATADMVNQIKLAMTEQNEGSKQISKALGEMNDATRQVKSAANEVDTARKRITNDTDGIRQSTAEVSNALETIKDGVNKIEEGDASLNAISTDMQESISRINEQIDQFKV